MEISIKSSLSFGSSKLEHWIGAHFHISKLIFFLKIPGNWRSKGMGATLRINFSSNTFSAKKTRYKWRAHKTFPSISQRTETKNAEKNLKMTIKKRKQFLLRIFQFDLAESNDIHHHIIIKTRNRKKMNKRERRKLLTFNWKIIFIPQLHKKR